MKPRPVRNLRRSEIVLNWNESLSTIAVRLGDQTTVVKRALIPRNLSKAATSVEIMRFRLALKVTALEGSSGVVWRSASRTLGAVKLKTRERVALVVAMSPAMLPAMNTRCTILRAI